MVCRGCDLRVWEVEEDGRNFRGLVMVALWCFA